MPDCIFCKIVNGDIPSTRVFENEYVFAFRDISPQAPVHILVVPKDHIASSIAELSEDNSHFAAKCLEAIAIIAKNEKLSGGFRVISNSGPDSGQTVSHLHFHILGGKPLGAGLVNN